MLSSKTAAVTKALSSAGTQARINDARRQIRRRGWAVVHNAEGVLDANGKPTTVSYTLGLTHCGLPEFVTTGLPAEIAEVALNELAWRAIGGGAQRPDALSAGVFTGLSVVLVDVEGSQMSVLDAAGSVLGVDFQAIQVVWPDADGRMPWNHEPNSPFRRDQPLLFTPPGKEESFPTTTLH
jgi:hypothetical protein